jgi:SOS-response transcriptional repressor LexA
MVAQNQGGKLALLNTYNGLRIYSDYFSEGMDKLRQRYLNIALNDVSLPPLSNFAKEITESQKAMVDYEDPVEPAQLSEQEIFEFNYLRRLRRIPIVGRIVASAPIPVPASDFFYFDAETSIEVVESLIPLGYELNRLFALEVDGDSMVDAMVNDGDIVILRPVLKKEDIRNGEMAAIWLPNRDESTLKYFYREKDGFRLQPANPTMAPILVSKDEPLEIKGKVVMVIRKVDTT